MEGWVDLGDWLHTKMVYLPAESPIQVVTRPGVEQLRWVYVLGLDLPVIISAERPKSDKV